MFSFQSYVYHENWYQVFLLHILLSSLLMLYLSCWKKLEDDIISVINVIQIGVIFLLYKIYIIWENKINNLECFENHMKQWENILIPIKIFINNYVHIYRSLSALSKIGIKQNFNKNILFMFLYIYIVLSMFFFVVVVKVCLEGVKMNLSFLLMNLAMLYVKKN